MTDESDMTPAGWPRPIVDGWPIPWVSPAHTLAAMDVDRLAEAATGKVCAVCGEAHGPADPVYIVVNGPEPPFSANTLAQAMDSAVMHKRCLQLATGKCPTLLRLIAEGRMLVLEVIAGDAEPHRPDEEIAVRFPITRCKVVGRSYNGHLEVDFSGLLPSRGETS